MTSCDDLAAFIRRHAESIVAAWGRAASELGAHDRPTRGTLRNELGRILDAIAGQLEASCEGVRNRSDSAAIADHVVQNAELGADLTTVAEELLTLRDAIEDTWPVASAPEASGAVRALRAAVEGILLATIARLTELRMAVLEAIDAVIAAYEPEASLEVMLARMLEVLLERIRGIDSLAILLREDNHRLRVRAAVGPEEPSIGDTIEIGRGFSGLIAAERRPRQLKGAADHPLIVEPVLRRARLHQLYGVPLCMSGELIGVAHMASFSERELPSETMWTFRVVMERVTSVITEQLLRERILLEQARYQAVAGNALSIIFSKDRDGRYLTVNRKALAELGLAPEVFIGRTDSDVFPPDAAEALRQSDLRVLESKTAVRLESRFVRGNEWRTYLIDKFPILDAGGNVVAIGGIATDITESRRAAAGQQLLAEAGGLLVSSLDHEETLTKLAEHVAASFAECCIIELTDERGAVRRTIAAHRDPDRVEDARALPEMPIDRGRPYLGDTVLALQRPLYMRHVSREYLETIAQNEEYARRLQRLAIASMIQVPLLAPERLLGAWIFIRSTNSASYDELDVGLARELGWRAALAIHAARLHDDARHAIEARDTILGVVAHDLRSPVGSVLLASQSLRRTLATGAPDASTLTPVVAALTRAAQHMDKLVSDLLDHYAIERGAISVAAVRWPAATLIGDAAESLRRQVEEAGASLEVTIGSDLGDVRADKERVQQVFGNLIANAIRFTPVGGRITMGARRGDRRVEFFVSDTGPGFEPEVGRHLFEAHWRGQSTARRSLGLGLAICRGIVEAHGGSIRATSELGHGATITFTLPEALVQDEKYAATAQIH